MFSLTITHWILIIGFIITSFLIFLTRKKNIATFNHFVDAVKGEKRKNVFVKIFSFIFNSFIFLIKNIFSFIFSFQLYYILILITTSITITYFVFLTDKIVSTTNKSEILDKKWNDRGGDGEKDDMDGGDDYYFILKVKDSIFTYEVTKQEYNTEKNKKGVEYFYVDKKYPEYYTLSKTIMIIFCIIFAVSTIYWMVENF